MRAARLHAFGEPLRIEEVPALKAAAGEMVVELTHSGVNPLDLRVCAGGAGRTPLPFVPGCEGTGRAAAGPVLVYGSGIGTTRAGTYADQIVAPENSVVPLPAGVDPVQAAGIGVAGATAWGVVHGGRGIGPEDRVLVLGASGGVGTVAVQLARSAGAPVWAQVATGADATLGRELGAEEVVVGGAEELPGAVRDLRPTVVVDLLGGPFTGAALRAVAPGGRILAVGVSAGDHGDLDFAALYRKGATVAGIASMMMRADEVRRALTECLELMARGRLRVQVGDVLPLEQVGEAHARLRERRATGKLLLSVAS